MQALERGLLPLESWTEHGGTGNGSGVDGALAEPVWGRHRVIGPGLCGLSSTELFRAEMLGAPGVFICPWPHRLHAQGSEGLVTQVPLPGTSKILDPRGRVVLGVNCVFAQSA